MSGLIWIQATCIRHSDDISENIIYGKKKQKSLHYYQAYKEFTCSKVPSLLLGQNIFLVDLRGHVGGGGRFQFFNGFLTELFLLIFAEKTVKLVR